MDRRTNPGWLAETEKLIIMINMTNTDARRIPLAEAKARLSAWVREAEDGTPFVITRHGKPVAALVPAGDLERLQRLRAAGPEGGLASVAGGWEGSDDLVERARAVRRGRPRGVEPTD